VICDAVQFYFKQILKVSGTARLLKPEDIHYFKMAGGFNSDWDLTEAAIVFFLWKRHTQELHSLEEIQQSTPSLSEFIEEWHAADGGLSNLYSWMAKQGTEDTYKRLRQQIDPAVVRKIFQEHYSGDQYCTRLYGSDQRYYHGRGRIHSERIILDRTALCPERFAYGILSGRTPEEIVLAMELMGLDGEIPSQAIVADNGVLPTKPDPWGLAEIAQQLSTKVGVYVGDTWDDLRTVLHHRENGHPLPMLFCYCLTGSTDEKTLAIFKANGADIIARDINVFLRYLHCGREFSRQI
jgi:HAD superfamily hydrolase (TIGR01548 family)